MMALWRGRIVEMPNRIWTALPRPGDDGAPEDRDVCITFATTVHGRYIPATYWEPAEYPELEHTFLTAQFDGWPGPLTDDEMAQMRDWFHRHQSEADDATSVEDEGRDPDEERDLRWDWVRDSRRDPWEEAA